MIYYINIYNQVTGNTVYSSTGLTENAMIEKIDHYGDVDFIDMNSDRIHHYNGVHKSIGNGLIVDITEYEEPEPGADLDELEFSHRYSF